MDHIQSIFHSLEQVRGIEKESLSLSSSDSPLYPSVSDFQKRCMESIKIGDLSSLQRHMEHFKSIYPFKSSQLFMIHKRQVNGNGRTILQEACAYGSVEFVEWILSNVDEDDKENHHNESCLWDKTTTKNVDVNQPSLIGKETALHIACFHGHDTIVSLLLNHYANPHLCNAQGKTCVDYCQGKPDVLALLTRI